MALLSFFIPKLNSIQILTLQTDGQYSYVKYFNICKILCVEHYTLIGQRISPAFQKCVVMDL